MKILTLSSLSVAFLLASSGCALLDGQSSGDGDGDGDRTGSGSRPGFGNSPNKGDGDGDTPASGVGCSSLCQQQGQCLPETDVATCISECDSARQESSNYGCGAEYDALLGCIDPCDTSAAACDGLVNAWLGCMTGEPGGTGGAGTGGSVFGGTGGIVVGTGGTFAGSGGSLVGVGGSPTTTGPASDFAYDGLGATQAGWYGYLFTVADALGGYINPAEGEPFVGAAVCADGYTAADWAGFGLIGFSIAQSIDPETLAGGDANEIVPGGTGVRVSVQNYAGSQLRVQIQDNSGTSWCAPVPVTGTGTIPWSSFNTMCWDGTGATYVGQPISQVMVQAPASSNLSPTAYDFCIISLDQAP